MSEPPVTFLDDMIRRVTASTVAGLALWGAIGGATNAIAVRVSAKEALRHIALGALIAAGLGGLGGPLAEHWGLLPIGVSAAGTGGTFAVAYLTGSLGSAVFEVVLSRIRAGRLPTDKEGA